LHGGLVLPAPRALVEERDRPAASYDGIGHGIREALARIARQPCLSGNWPEFGHPGHECPVVGHARR